MELKKIEEFAKSRGFKKIKYIGEYEGKPAYAPLREKMAYIGMPFFILVNGNKLEMITGKQGLKILNELLSKKPAQDSKTYVAVKDGQANICDARLTKAEIDSAIANGAEWRTLENGVHVLIQNGNVLVGAGGALSEDLPKDTDEARFYLGSDSEGRSLISTIKYSYKVDYKPVEKLKTPLSENAIINEIGGRDKTKGSCFSLCLAYTAQKGGYDVVDFRGGNSANAFCKGHLIDEFCKDGILKSTHAKNEYSVAASYLKYIMKQPSGKEFIFSIGAHAAILLRCCWWISRKQKQ